MNRRRTALTEEQQAKAEARRERFRNLVSQLAGLSPDEREALAARSHPVTIEGHRLSGHNACLLALQDSCATVVGGFRQWLTAGRIVRKGEHGSMIWAPVKKRDGNGQESIEPEPGELTNDHPRFVMVTVFDVAQTDAR